MIFRCRKECQYALGGGWRRSVTDDPTLNRCLGGRDGGRTCRSRLLVGGGRVWGDSFYSGYCYNAANYEQTPKF